MRTLATGAGRISPALQPRPACAGAVLGVGVGSAGQGLEARGACAPAAFRGRHDRGAPATAAQPGRVRAGGGSLSGEGGWRVFDAWGVIRDLFVES